MQLMDVAATAARLVGYGGRAAAAAAAVGYITSFVWPFPDT